MNAKPYSLAWAVATLLSLGWSATAQAQCTAVAGAMSPDESLFCLVNGQATISATPNGLAWVPAGFEQAYVLTRTNGLIIEQVGPDPSFTATSEDVWRIHSLVYDPTTLDLSQVQLGSTYAYEVQPLLIQGGGDICAALDMNGAPMKTGYCEVECTASAGTLSAAQSDLCLVNGLAVMEVIPNGDAVVPDGFAVAYILAQGDDQVIQNVEPFNHFEWPLTGEYTIHTFVYEPGSMDPYDVQLGLSTLAQFNALLQQGGGIICGSLDMVGAFFSIIDCPPPCDAYAGEGGDITICYNSDTVPLLSLLTGNPDGDGTWYGPNGLAHADDFIPGLDAEGVYIYLVSGGPNCPDDSSHLVISLIECSDPCDGAGENASITACSNDEPFSLWAALGGDPCPGGYWYTPNGAVHEDEFVCGLDAPGIYTYLVIDPFGGQFTAFLTVNVVECLIDAHVMEKETPETAFVLRPWPNPSTDVVRITVENALSSAARLEVTDATGRVALLPVVFSGKSIVLDARSLHAGAWTVRLIDGATQHVGRFVRAED